MRLFRKCKLYVFLLLFYVFLASIFLLHGQLYTQNDIYEVPDWDERVQKVGSVCNNTPVLLPSPPQLQQTDLPEPLKKHFLNLFGNDLVLNIARIPALNLDWCLVPKVASTSLSKLFLPYLPDTEEIFAPFIQKEVWQKAGHLTLEQFNSGQNSRFLISRHPFARISSAYRNKLEDRTRSHDGNYFFNTYSKQIIKLSRGTVSDDSPEPSFPEFIKFILNSEIYDDDEHWQPVSLRCRLCQLEFTHILRYEELSTDWEYFKQDVSLPPSLLLPWENKGKLGALPEYFKQISREDLEKLGKRYESDFLMFGYRMEDDF